MLSINLHTFFYCDKNVCTVHIAKVAIFCKWQLLTAPAAAEKGFLAAEMLTTPNISSIAAATVAISSKFRSWVPTKISAKCNTNAFQNWRHVRIWDLHRVQNINAMWVKSRNQMKFGKQGCWACQRHKISWISCNCRMCVNCSVRQMPFSMWVQLIRC